MAQYLLLYRPSGVQNPADPNGYGELSGNAELVSPWDRVTAEGGRPVLVSPAQDEIQLFEHLVSSRKPDDLPAFCDTMTQVFAQHA